MTESKPTYQELEKKIRELERKAKQGKTAENRLKKLEKQYEKLVDERNKKAKMISVLRSSITMPELYLDQKWNIVGYSGDFPFLTRKVEQFAKKRKNLREFLNKGDFDRLLQFQKTTELLKELPYDQGKKWRLRYKGPNSAEKIGKNWIEYEFSGENKWQIIKDRGKQKIIHQPHISDLKDCYLMTAEEFGGSDEDVKIIYRVKTSKKPEYIRDLSLVISGGSGLEETLPDLVGYTICSGSNFNSQARIQRQINDITTAAETLEPDTEYQITVERTGGRIRRVLKNLETQKDAEPLEMIDKNAVYDRQNHIGFTTYCGEVEIYDIEIYTRKSQFSIDSFKIPFDVIVGIRDKNLLDRIYKLRLGKDATTRRVLNTLLFEDITEQGKMKEELEKERATLSNIISLNPYSISIYDAEGHYERGNQAYLDLFKASPPPDYSLFNDPILAKEGYSEEVLKLKDGEVVEIPELWYNPKLVKPELPDRSVLVRGLAFPVLDNEGKVEHIVAVHENITEQNRVEEALRLSEEKYRTLIENTNDIVYQMDPEGFFTYISPQIKRYGYKPEEIISSSFTDFLLPEDRGKIVSDFQKTLESEEEFPTQFKIKDKKGGIHWVEEYSKVLRDEAGRVCGLAGTLRDITERKQAEEALRESEAQKQALLDGSPDMIVQIDTNMRIVWANKSALNIYPDAVGQICHKAFVNTDEPCSNCPSKKCMDTGQIQMVETYQSAEKDIGSGSYWEDIGVPLKDSDGKIVGAIEIARNITERKQAEEDLRQSEETARAILNAPTQSVLLLDSERVILDLNEPAAQLLGKSSDELIGKCYDDLLPPATAESIKEYCEKVIQSSMPVRFEDEREVILLDTPAFAAFFDNTIYPVFNAKGKVFRFAVFSHDITTRKKAEEALRVSEEKYRALIENTNDVVYQVDRDGVFTYISPQVKSYGYNPEEMISRSAADFILPEDTEKTFGDFQKTMETGAEFPTQFRIVDNKGGIHWIEEYGKVLRDEAGRIYGLTGALRDITERKQAEEELKKYRDHLEEMMSERTAELTRTNQKLQQEIAERKRVEDALRQSEREKALILDTMSEQLIYQDKEMKILWTNRAACEPVSKVPEELAGHYCYEMWHNRSEPCPDCPVKRVGETGESQEGEITTFDGRILFVRAYPVKDEKGDIVGTLEVTGDITERKQAEEELRKSEEKYRDLVENINDVLMVIDTKGVITYISPLIESLSGYYTSEIISKTFKEFVYPEDLPEVKKRFQKVLKGIIEPIEFRLVDRSGDLLWVYISGRPIYKNDRIVGFQGTMTDITERKKAEEALRESEERFRRIFENIRDMYYRADLEGKLTMVNPLGVRMMGYDGPEEVIGKDIAEEFYHRPEDRTAVMEELEKHGEIKNREIIIKRKDGTPAILEVSSHLVYDETGKPIAIEGLARDITERKRAEEALRESEERYRDLIEGTFDMVQSVRPDGSFFFVNKSWMEALGYNEEELADITLFDIIHPEYLSHCKKIFSKIIAGKYIRNIEAAFVTKDGWEILVEGNATPRYLGGEVVGTQAFFRDVTERKQAEIELRKARDELETRVIERTAALRKSESQLQERLNELTCLFKIRQEFDKGHPLENTLIRCTEHIRQGLNAPERKGVAITLDDRHMVFDMKFMPSDNCLRIPLVISGRRRGSLHVYCYASDSKYQPFEQDLAKEAGATLSSFIQNRELQAQLVQTEKLAATGRVAAGVAHEINNPLGAIRNSLYILKDVIQADHDDYSYVELIEAEIDRMAGIIAQLYDLYKPTSRKTQPVKLNNVVDNVLKMMQAKIHRGKVNVHDRLDRSIPRLNTSVDQLTQVLYNLIDNSLQAMPDGGFLTITSEMSSGRTELSITDTGKGIPDDVVPHIFEPFFTTKGMNDIPGEGMGMGLSLSRSIMESLGGGISVRTALGKGTTFILDFPAE